jgi:hypothetical protein
MDRENSLTFLWPEWGLNLIPSDPQSDSNRLRHRPRQKEEEEEEEEEEAAAAAGGGGGEEEEEEKEEKEEEERIKRLTLYADLSPPLSAMFSPSVCFPRIL